MKNKLTVCLFAGLQINMREIGMLTEAGEPLCSRDLTDEDMFYVYKYIATNITDYDETTKIVEDYNKVVNSLTDDYNLNNMMMVLAMVEKYVDEFGSHQDHIAVLPKVVRLLKTVRGYIEPQIALESTQAASTLYEMLKGNKGLTKAERAELIAKWKGLKDG